MLPARLVRVTCRFRLTRDLVVDTTNMRAEEAATAIRAAVLARS